MSTTAGWSVAEVTDQRQQVRVYDGDRLIACFGNAEDWTEHCDEWLGHARLACTAVNAFDSLRGALREAIDHLERLDKKWLAQTYVEKPVLNNCRAVLAEAERHALEGDGK